MALRVLLADESSTIKKVVQLALQDFAVDVKAVPVGLDVLAVAKTYKPDIIFADVLITKKNGYEVCAEIKSDPATKDIPVVLMWSGFMEIDESKLAAASADDRLEKPFDADALRNLVHRWVPRTLENPISQYLHFPEMPEFEEMPSDANVSQGFELGTIPSLDSSDEVADEMAHVNLSIDLPAANLDETQLGTISAGTSTNLIPDRSSDEEGDEAWTQQDLSKFKIQIPKDALNSEYEVHTSPSLEIGTTEYEEIQFGESFSNKHIASPDFQEITKTPPPVQKPTKPAHTTEPKASATVPKASAPQPSVKAVSSGDTSPEMIEKIIREEVREVIESICWKILPDMAERLVKEEIKKLLGDKDSSL